MSNAKLFKQFKFNPYKANMAPIKILTLKGNLLHRYYATERKSNNTKTRDLLAKVYLRAIYDSNLTNLNQLNTFLDSMRNSGHVTPSTLTIVRWIEKYQLNCFGNEPRQVSQLIRKYKITT